MINNIFVIQTNLICIELKFKSYNKYYHHLLIYFKFIHIIKNKNIILILKFVKQAEF